MMSYNVANQITDMAINFPYKKAVVEPCGYDINGDYKYTHYTFIQLEKRINQFSNALVKYNIKKGERVLLFVKPCKDFSALVFSLFKIGAVPVLIDPGMGVKNLLNAVEQVKADVLIGIPKVHLIRRLFKSRFKNIKLFLTTGKVSIFTPSLINKAKNEIFIFESLNMQPNDPAAILFTSGGTGIPKGVIYTHEIFINQTKMLQEEFALTEDDVDIPGFPLFALFTLAMGMTSCIPDMDPSKPSKANPEKIIKNIMDHGATFVAGSPAIWENIADYCLENRLTLPSINFLVMFGAPISIDLHNKFKKILVDGTTFTPYGATECLPVSNISGKEVLSETSELSLQGKGTCVGLPFPGVKIKIIKSTDNIIDDINDCLFLNPYEVGEIIVQSKTVTPAYFEMPEKTLEAKIKDETGLWHRMGDVGYLDDKGRLWFCGRKTHAITINDETHYSIPVESIFNQHPKVKKTALIKNHNRLGLVIERFDKKINLSKPEKESLKNELLFLGAKYNHTENINHFFLSKKLPVDIRHNIKIDRLKLTEEFIDKDSL